LIYTSLRLDKPEYWGLEKQESIGKMLQILREKELNQGTGVILASQNSKLIKKLKARRNRVHRKPVDKVADSNLRGEMIASQ
jgi:hypothetical protein